jgi:hypothetical protein
MAIGGEDKSKKKNLDRHMNLLETNMIFGRLVVFLRHDSAEIWRFGHELTLCIGTLKIIASTGVFVRVVLALNALLAATREFQPRF